MQQLAELAAAAEVHAQQRHGASLHADSWARIDDILNREREQGDPRDRESVALCYGAWIGQALVAEQQAEWTGLHEPVPPRIRLRGVCYSPIEAVQRRLTNPAAASIQELVSRTICQRSPHVSSGEEEERENNRSAWDRRAEDARFANPEAVRPANGEEIPAALDPWLAEVDLTGLHVLCLAAAGGTHGPLYAHAGAHVTVADFSPALLALDEAAARRHQLDLTTVRADLQDLSPLRDQQFDIVLQPVSSCYIPDLQPMYAGIARVLKPGGLYLSQHKSPTSLQAAAWSPSASAYVILHPAAEGHRLPPDPATTLPQREAEMTEYVHTLAALLGGLCRSGFIIEDVQEPLRGDAWAVVETAEHRAGFLPPYLKVLARRIDETPL